MQKDVAVNSLIDENDVFADIANVNLFDGEERILPDDISSASIVGYYREAGGKQHKLLKDTAKEIASLNGCIVFMGFESQNGVSNIMPVRNMGYVYTTYAKQVNDYIAENRKNKRYAFTKEIHDDQRLKPVVTYVLYFGEEKWERPLSIMDMLDINEEDRAFWEQIIDDYPIKVIHMANQPEEVRNKYKSDFKIIADYLACRHDKEKMEHTVYASRHKLVHVEQVLDLLEILSNDKRFEEIKVEYIEHEKEKGGEPDMCLLMDLVDEKVEAGVQRGRKEGIKTGMNLSASIYKIIQTGINDNNEISKKCSCTIEEVEEVRVAFGI